jgi:hypothetical protein
MEGYLCPNKKCKTELHYELFGGKIRVCAEIGKKKIYNAYCPTCDEYMQVDERNKKYEV